MSTESRPTSFRLRHQNRSRQHAIVLASVLTLMSFGCDSSGSDPKNTTEDVQVQGDQTTPDANAQDVEPGDVEPNDGADPDVAPTDGSDGLVGDTTTSDVHDASSDTTDTQMGDAPDGAPDGAGDMADLAEDADGSDVDAGCQGAACACSALLFEAAIPAANAHTLTPTGTIEFQMSCALSAPGPDALMVRSNLRGFLPGNLELSSSDTLRFTPNEALIVGERLTTTLSSDVRSTDGKQATTYVVEHWVAPTQTGVALVARSLGGSARKTTGHDLGDFNRDGRPDIMFSNGLDGEFGTQDSVYMNTPGSSPPFVELAQSLGLSFALSVAVGDLDGDGDLDAYVSADPTDKVYLNDGAGNFSDGAQVTGGSRVSVLVDIDQDGDLDVVRGGTEFELLVNGGRGAFTVQNLTTLSSTARALAVGDVDRDGDLDVLVTTDDDTHIWLYDAAAGLAPQRGLPQMPGGRGLALGDVDNDGDLDAVLVGTEVGVVYLNDGSATMTATSDDLSDDRCGGVALGDIDGDGDLDAIVVKTFGSDHSLWLNTNGTFALTTAPSTGSGRKAEFADVDADGDLDAVISGFADNVLWSNGQ